MSIHEVEEEDALYKSDDDMDISNEEFNFNRAKKHVDARVTP